MLRAVLREVVGLFVDDGTLALGAVVWLGLCALLFRNTAWGGIALFLGLAALLGENTLRTARRRRGNH